MNSTPSTTEKTILLQSLRNLKSTPSPDFLERVLRSVGLPSESDEFVLANGPTGKLFIAFNHRGINHVLAAQIVDENPHMFAERHRERFGRSVRRAVKEPVGLNLALRSQQGQKLTYDLGGLSDFEKSVLRKALEIPRGEIRPYAWIAREIGRPKAVRAVGSALGRNPVPVLIPCHRVVRSDGQIGEYAFGTEMKRELLVIEHVDIAEVERLARSGVHFVGSNTTNIFCYPTCHNARRVSNAHRIVFRRVEDAVESGFRPCLNCRPDDIRSA